MVTNKKLKKENANYPDVMPVKNSAAYFYYCDSRNL